ncbi:MAG TPA: HNH endonuclease signature motif containing protein [Longimicrobium sp.]|nr:HNH endonuclease signature motif containing protein [Longimicrobium sp.]
MRPVELPTDPPSEYHQDQYQAGSLRFKQSGTFVTEEVQACEVELNALMDLWLSNRLEWDDDGLRLLSIDPAENEALNDDFDRYARALARVDTYGFARPVLIARIGAYCSYCEMPLAANLAVEHVLPRKWFPELQLAWSNFLLCCPICNSIKGAYPSQDIEGTVHGTAEAKRLLEGLYAWPNLYWQTWPSWPPAGGAGPMLPFTYVLHRIRPFGTGWKDGGVVTPAELGLLVDAFEQGHALVTGGALGFARQTAPNPERDRFDYYQLEIVPRSGVAVLPEVAQAAERMISLVGLNRILPSTRQAASDLRGAYRTQVFFRALSLRRRLEQAEWDSPLLAEMTADIHRCMTLTGYWSVWSFVLAELGGQAWVNAAFPGTPDVDWTG